MFVCLHIDMILMEAAALPSLHRSSSSITHTPMHGWMQTQAQVQMQQGLWPGRPGRQAMENDAAAVC